MSLKKGKKRGHVPEAITGKREREENYDEAHAALLWATEFIYIYIYILQLLIWQSHDKISLLMAAYY